VAVHDSHGATAHDVAESGSPQCCVELAYHLPARNVTTYTPVLSRSVLVVSRAPRQALAAGIGLPESGLPPCGHRHPQLGGHFNPAQVAGLTGHNSLGFGGVFAERNTMTAAAIGGSPLEAASGWHLPRGLGPLSPLASELVRV
jgi:hypothetical protein